MKKINLKQKKHYNKLAIFVIIIGAFFGQAQQPKKVLFEENAWEIKAKEYKFTDYQGKKALVINNGSAVLKNTEFKNGIIEYDVNFNEDRKFVGVNFRMEDATNYEEYYLRPHQSGNPDAMQYSPVWNGTAAWQLYHGKGYGVPFSYLFDEWMHIKLVIQDKRMDVYINDMKTPILMVNDLKRTPSSGKIGFNTFLGQAYYANLSYIEKDVKDLLKPQDTNVESIPGLVRDWEVSAAMANTKFAKQTSLKEVKIDFNKSLQTEDSGILNLAQISKVTETTNTILTKFTLEESSATIKRLNFGYSDRVRVFVNGDLIYAGNNSFRSRDYRYLGTIGLHDAIYLDLKKGTNEIVFAVTERMGGWGIMAQIE